MKKILQELEDVAEVVRNNINTITKEKLHNFEYGLADAMRYSALAPGKMIRSYLVYNFCNILDISKVSFLNLATSVELMHCYSLIHDDLPAMDDDDMRRGQKSSHKQYDVATAILAGDALQALAFEILAQPNTSNQPADIVKLVLFLAQTVGYTGMVGGQYLDLKAEKHESIEKVIHMQKLKTGKLIEFSCVAPALIANPVYKKKRAIMNYAHDVGFAYQIKDDLLDVVGNKDKMGKKAAKDKDKGKNNLVTHLGVDKATQQLELLTKQAKNHLNIFGESAANLRIFTDYLLERDK
jgi:farnesyl diphosphate synthase